MDFAGTFCVLTEEECMRHPNTCNLLRVVRDKDVYVDPTPLYDLPFLALADRDTGYAFTGGFANSCSFVNSRGTLEPAPNAQFEAIAKEGGAIESLAIVALRDIMHGEEVIVDYHWTFQPYCECYNIECRRTRRRYESSQERNSSKVVK